MGVVTGGSAQLLGTSITTTGAGSGGVAINGSTASFTGNDLTILVKGGYDATNQFAPAGVANQSFSSYSGGGTVKLTNSSITVIGDYGVGVHNANAGSMTVGGGSIATSGLDAQAVLTETAAATTLTNVAISTSAAGAVGVQSASGGQTTINGGTIQTTGSGSLGLQATGTGSSITTALNDGVGLAITTTGADAHGAQADTGGTITLVGGTVTTSGSARSVFTRPARVRKSRRRT